MNIKEILDKLPSSWEQINLKQYLDLTTIVIEEEADNPLNGIENTLSVISKLTDTPVSELEALPMHHIQQLGTKLAFMANLPEVSKNSSLKKWKKLEDISYNDYIFFVQVPQGKHLDNLQTFIKNFSQTTMTEEEILALPVTDVFNGFFLCRIQLDKYLNRSIRSTALKLMKQRIQMNIQAIKMKVIGLRKK